MNLQLKKKKKLVYALLFPEYLISTKSVSPACPFVCMKYIKISEIIIIIIIIISSSSSSSSSIIGIIIIIIIIIISSCYCGILLAIGYSYDGITIQFKIIFVSFFV